MKLTDLISEQEEHGIRTYLEEVFDYPSSFPLYQIFKEYNKNKLTMYRVLGKQLRRTFSIELDADLIRQTRKIREVYSNPIHLEKFFNPFYYRNIAQINGVIKNISLAKIMFWIREKFFEKYRIDKDTWFHYIEELTNIDFPSHKYLDWLKETTARRLDAEMQFDKIFRIISWENIINGALTSDINDLSCVNIKSLKAGTKPMKIFRKVLNKLGYTDWDTFEKFRNEISDLNFSRKEKITVTLSCHPADLLSLSDNANDWHSCYSLLQKGCYSLSPLEMLNSNNVIVAYIESKKPFINGEIPSKSWRCLIYITKDLLLLGKSYPYYWKELDNKVLELAANLVKENLKWDYTYKNQSYQDTLFLMDNESLGSSTKDLSQDDIGGKKIIPLTDKAYNDIINSADSGYICYRNKPKRGKTISVSGPKTCLICGDRLDRYYLRSSHIQCCHKCNRKIKRKNAEAV